MPEPLWRAAVELAREHGVYAVAQALRVSYSSLRTWTEAAGATRRASPESSAPLARFVELPPAVLSAAAVAGGSVVEVVGPSGQRLTVRLRSGEHGKRPSHPASSLKLLARDRHDHVNWDAR
jgi:hypothetical protein